jgi:hypothetical protein
MVLPLDEGKSISNATCQRCIVTLPLVAVFAAPLRNRILYKERFVGRKPLWKGVGVMVPKTKRMTQHEYCCRCSTRGSRTPKGDDREGSVEKNGLSRGFRHGANVCHYRCTVGNDRNILPGLAASNQALQLHDALRNKEESFPP